MVRISLQSEGYEVWEAPTGQVALDMVQRQRPDLILQDLMLPDINGVDLVQQLRNTPGGAEIPIICFSGFVSRGEEARVAGAGFTDFLVKPVEPSQLVPDDLEQIDALGVRLRWMISAPVIRT